MDRQNKPPFHPTTPAARPQRSSPATTSCSHILARPSTPPQPAGAAGKAIIPASFVADFHKKIEADWLQTGLLLTPREGTQRASRVRATGRRLCPGAYMP